MRVRDYVSTLLELAIEATAKNMAKMSRKNAKAEKEFILSLHTRPAFNEVLNILTTNEDPAKAIEDAVFGVHHSYGLSSQVQFMLVPGNVDIRYGKQWLAVAYFHNVVSLCLSRQPQLSLQADLEMLSDFYKKLGMRKSPGLTPSDEMKLKTYLRTSFIDVDDFVEKLREKFGVAKAVSEDAGVAVGSLPTGQYL